jgi:hypothetical protein
MINSIVFADAHSEMDAQIKKPNIAEKTFSYMVRGIAYQVYSRFLKDNNVTLDSLVYNKDVDNYNISLYRINTEDTSVGNVKYAKGDFDPLASFFRDFYYLFQYIGIGVVMVLGIWHTLLFRNLGGNPQKLAKLRDTMRRWFISIMLMLNAPLLLDVLVKFNAGFTDIFYTTVSSKLSQASNSNTGNGFLLDTFLQIAVDDSTLVSALVYLMAVVLNVYLLFYYFVRDLTICFLFMVFPFLASFHSAKKDIVGIWFREIASNIFTQAIQGVVFAVVLIMAVVLPKTFYFELFTLTAFAMVLPFTQVFKVILGLEGNIGGAKSLAGFGGFLTAMTLGKTALSLGKNAVSGTANSLSDLSRARTGMKKLDKNIGDKGLELARSGLSPDERKTKELELQNLKNRKEVLQNQQRRAGRKLLSTGVGFAGGVFGGVTMGVGTAPLGKNVAMAFATGGMLVGQTAGQGLGLLAGSGLSAVGGAMDLYKISHADSTKTNQENEEEYFGLNNPEFQADKEFTAKELRALKTQKILNAVGLKSAGEFAYASMTPARKSQEQLEKMNNLKMSMSKDKSVLYTEDEKGNKAIQWIGAGDASMKDGEIAQYAVGFNNGTMQLSEGRLEDLKQQAGQSVVGDEIEGQIKSSEDFMNIKNEEIATMTSRNQGMYRTQALDEAKKDSRYLQVKEVTQTAKELATSRLRDEKLAELTSQGVPNSQALKESEIYARNHAEFQPEYLDAKRQEDEWLDKIAFKGYESNGIKVASLQEQIESKNRPNVEELAEQNALSRVKENMVNHEFSRLQRAELTNMKNLRGVSGLSNIVPMSEQTIFNDKSGEYLFNPQSQEQFVNKINEVQPNLPINEVEKMEDLRCYQDSEKTIIYQQQDNGVNKTLWQGKGDATLTTSRDFNVGVVNKKEIEPMLESQAKNIVSSMPSSTIMSSEPYISSYQNGIKEIIPSYAGKLDNDSIRDFASQQHATANEGAYSVVRDSMINDTYNNLVGNEIKITGNNNIPEQRLNELQQSAVHQVENNLMANSIESTPQYQNAYSQIVRNVVPSYNPSMGNVVEFINDKASVLEKSSYDTATESLIKDQYVNLQGQHSQISNQLQTITGSNIAPMSVATEFQGDTRTFYTNQNLDMLNMDNNATITTNQPIPEESILRFYQGANSTDYYREYQDANGTKLIHVATSEGNPSCASGTCNYGQAIYTNGNIYQDKTTYSLDGSVWEYQNPNTTEKFDAEIIPSFATQIANDTPITIIPVINSTGESSLQLFNAKSNDYIGEEYVTPTLARQLQDVQVMHVYRDASGSYQTHYEGQMTDRDYHLINNANYTSEVKNIKQRKALVQEKIEDIGKKKNELLEYVDVASGFRVRSTVNRNTELLNSL